MNMRALVKRLAKAGLADLLDVRRELSAAGLDRQQQDAAINAARRAGQITGCARESWPKPTSEQLAANLPDGIGQVWVPGEVGHLWVSEE
jgi:hypothetical protein